MKATFSIRHPYIAAILAGLLCTFMTAIGSAVPQIVGLGANESLLFTTAALLVSSLIGIMIMKKSRFSLFEYGFRYNEANSNRKVLFLIPLIVIELLPLVLYGFSDEITPMKYLMLFLFTIAVGFNEEIYFRGLALKYIGVKGIKAAIIWSSFIFGVLHLVNAFSQENIVLLLLQVAFAFLVGIVLAEIVSITNSLWFVIGWHMLHDFIAFTTEDVIDTKAIIILAVQVAVLLAYAIFLWKKCIAEERNSSQVSLRT